MEDKKILNADEAREIAFKKQDEDYLDNLKKIKSIINEEISIHSKLGDTYFVLTKSYDNLTKSYKKNWYSFPYGIEGLYIDKTVFDEIKKELKPRGFKVRKGILKIKISWYE